MPCYKPVSEKMGESEAENLTSSSFLPHRSPDDDDNDDGSSSHRVLRLTSDHVSFLLGSNKVAFKGSCHSTWKFEGEKNGQEQDHRAEVKWPQLRPSVSVGLINRQI